MKFETNLIGERVEILSETDHFTYDWKDCGIIRMVISDDTDTIPTVWVQKDNGEFAKFFLNHVRVKPQ